MRIPNCLKDQYLNTLCKLIVNTCTFLCVLGTTDSVESFTAKTREAASVVSVTEHDCDSCGSYQSTGNVLRHSVHPRDLTTLQGIINLYNDLKAI